MRKVLYSVFVFIALLSIIQSCSKDNSLSPSTSGGGKSGSLTTFAVTGSYMYALDANKLKVYNVSDAKNPVLKNEVSLGYEIETIFSYEGNLFIGASDGVFILDISNPEKPIVNSKYEHVQSCDPVVAQGTTAYSTVRTSSTCSMRANVSSSQLLVLDVTNKTNPILTNSISMNEPYGLAVEGNALYVCDGSSGLKLFDVTIPTQPVLTKTISGINARDVISNGNILLVSTPTSYIFYNVSNLSNVQKLSELKH